MLDTFKSHQNEHANIIEQNLKSINAPHWFRRVFRIQAYRAILDVICMVISVAVIVLNRDLLFHFNPISVEHLLIPVVANVIALAPRLFFLPFNVYYNCRLCPTS